MRDECLREFTPQMFKTKVVLLLNQKCSIPALKDGKQKRGGFADFKFSAELLFRKLTDGAKNNWSLLLIGISCWEIRI